MRCFKHGVELGHWAAVTHLMLSNESLDFKRLLLLYVDIFLLLVFIYLLLLLWALTFSSLFCTAYSFI